MRYATPPDPSSNTPYSFTRFNRSALAITETEDSDIAAAAIIGDRSTPKTG